MTSGTHPLDFHLPLCHTNRVNQTTPMSEVLELNQAEIRALLRLIEFQTDEDCDELEYDETLPEYTLDEVLGVDVAQLYKKVSSLVTY